MNDRLLQSIMEIQNILRPNNDTIEPHLIHHDPERRSSVSNDSIHIGHDTTYYPQENIMTSIPFRTSTPLCFIESPELEDLSRNFDLIRITPTKLYPNAVSPLEELGDGASSTQPRMAFSSEREEQLFQRQQQSECDELTPLAPLSIVSNDGEAICSTLVLSNLLKLNDNSAVSEADQNVASWPDADPQDINKEMESWFDFNYHGTEM
jgi:hypothetical protein